VPGDREDTADPVDEAGGMGAADPMMETATASGTLAREQLAVKAPATRRVAVAFSELAVAS
jgi:hypothetical protein